MAKGTAVKVLALGGLVVLAYVFIRASRVKASALLPNAAVIPTPLPEAVAALQPVIIEVVKMGDTQTLQPTVAVSEITPIVATPEIYAVLAGRELTPAELAIAPPLVLLPSGIVATYIPPLVSPSVLDITDLQVVVTGRASGYSFRFYEIPPFLATVTITVTADKDYSPSGIFLQGFGLYRPELTGEEERTPLPNTDITIPQGVSRYSWEVWIPVYVERAFSPTIAVPGAPTGRYVVYGGATGTMYKPTGSWGLFTISIISGPGYQAAELQRKMFDRQDILKSQVEQMLGASITLIPR